MIFDDATSLDWGVVLLDKSVVTATRGSRACLPAVNAYGGLPTSRRWYRLHQQEIPRRGVRVGRRSEAQRVGGADASSCREGAMTVCLEFSSCRMERGFHPPYSPHAAGSIDVEVRRAKPPYTDG